MTGLVAQSCSLRTFRDPNIFPSERNLLNPQLLYFSDLSVRFAAQALKVFSFSPFVDMLYGDHVQIMVFL